MTSSESFVHTQGAHCESGVTGGLLTHANVPISEAMAFGLGSGLFFVYIPFVKVMGLPLTSYRSFPGSIFKKTCKRLKIPYAYRTFSDPITGARALDDLLQAKRAVGIRSNIFWLPYIPEKFRFQFNAHNLVIYGKQEGGDYRVSDPVLETVSLCDSRSLNKARFSRGPLAPNGLIFYPMPSPPLGALEWRPAIKKAIRETVQRMLYVPLPFFGVKGIRYLSRQIEKWPQKIPDLDRRKLYLANVVRMQEEIGTGGAGFRFLYAAFLQEAGELLNEPALLTASKAMTDVGNLWREFATLSAKFCKDRLEVPFAEIPSLLLKIADAETKLYKDLRRDYL